MQGGYREGGLGRGVTLLVNIVMMAHFQIGGGGTYYGALLALRQRRLHVHNHPYVSQHINTYSLWYSVINTKKKLKKIEKKAQGQACEHVKSTN